MALTRKESDAILTTKCGYSQEYLDRVYKGVEAFRAALGPRLETGPQEWEELESDSDFDDAHIEPTTNTKRRRTLASQCLSMRNGSCLLLPLHKIRVFVGGNLSLLSQFQSGKSR